MCHNKRVSQRAHGCLSLAVPRPSQLGQAPGRASAGPLRLKNGGGDVERTRHKILNDRGRRRIKFSRVQRKRCVFITVECTVLS